MRKIITNDYGQIMLGDKLIPGIYKGLSIGGEVRVKEEEAEGSSGKYKQALGWEDIELTLTLLLANDEESTPYEKLAEVVALFRKTDAAAKPEVYRITNKLCAVWGLDKVLIKELKADDPETGDYIRVTISMVEFISPLVKVEARAMRPPAIDRNNPLPENRPFDLIPGSDDDVYKEVIEVPDDD